MLAQLTVTRFKRFQFTFPKTANNRRKTTLFIPSFTIFFFIPVFSFQAVGNSEANQLRIHTVPQLSPFSKSKAITSPKFDLENLTLTVIGTERYYFFSSEEIVFSVFRYLIDFVE